MRWILAVMAIVGVSTPGWAFAEDAASQTAAMTPLEVLSDGLEAVESGDFERYVDHLTADEQRMQAGYVLYTVVAVNELLRNDAAKPEIRLMTQGLRDVAIDHLLPRDRQPGDPEPTDETPEMLVRKLLLSLFVQPVRHMPAGSEYPPVPQYETQPTFDQVCLKASKRLKDPRQFLIDALQELSTATEVSGAEPGRPIESLDLAAHARMYQEVKWTLYTRGDRALAVPNIPKPEKPKAPRPGSNGKTPSGAVNEPVALGHQPATPPPSDDDATSIRIEFRKLDGRWKIAHLLPVAKMQAGIQVAPNTTQRIPYPAEWK